MEDTFKYSTMSPGTFRKKLEKQGINYTQQSSDLVIQNFDDQCDDVKKLTYQILPMRIKELESCLENQNMNVIELKESLEYVMQRENQLMNEYQIYKLEAEETFKNSSNLIKQQQSEIEKKSKIIEELQFQLNKKEDDLSKANGWIIDNKLKLNDYIDKIKKFEFGQKEIEMRLQINEKELQYFKQENKQIREEKRQYIQGIEEVEKQLYDKENKLRQVIQDKKMEIEQYIQKYSEVNNELEIQQKEMQTKNGQIKKLQSQLDLTSKELADIKNSILELATLATSTNISSALSNMNYNVSEISTLPYKYLSTFLELIRDALIKYKKK